MNKYVVSWDGITDHRFKTYEEAKTFAKFWLKFDDWFSKQGTTLNGLRNDVILELYENYIKTKITKL